MRLTDCMPQRLSKLFIGGLFFVGAVALILSGFTLLPVIGFVFAVPFIVLGVYFIRLHLNRECQIDFS